MRKLAGVIAALVLSALTVTCLTGCNINNGPLDGPCGLPGANCQDQDPSEDPTFPPCSTLTLYFPETDGYSVGATIAAFEAWNNYDNCVTGPFTKTISLTPFDEALTPPPGEQTLMYFEFTAQNDQFIEGYPAVSITVPPNVALNGNVFYLAANYYGGPYGSWSLDATGPLSINGRTLSGLQAGNIVFDLGSGSPFEFALYSVPK